MFQNNRERRRLNVARAWVAQAALLGVASCFTSVAKAEESPGANGPPRCALIDFDRSPLAAVLEAKLLGEVDATWLERNAIDKVVKEQELQALFTPQGGAERSALGKLLKADILILVRDAPLPPPDKSAESSPKTEKPVPAIDLAVTEARRGLRLLSRSVPRSDNAEDDADALVQFVREALGKYRQQVTEIYAVPPFVSRDLGYEHDYLRGTYSRLLEQMLLDRPGALVVELEEAQSLAKEIALADAGSSLKRNVPFYLLGEYRHDGQGDNQSMRLSLKLMRGEQQLEERSLDNTAPSESAASLRTLAAELVGAAAGAKQVAVDPAAETESLNRREKLFLRLGQWADALSLAEASLLLTPRQADMHHDAVVALTGLTRENWDIHPIDFQRQWRAVGYQNRGLEHIEAFMRLDANPDVYGNAAAGGYIVELLRAAGGNVRVNSIYPQERNDTIIALQKRRRAALERIIPWAARSNWKCEYWLLHDLLGVLPVEAQCEAVYRLIDEVKDLPGARKRVVWYSNSINPGAGRQAAWQRDECLRPLYERLANIDNAEVQQALRELQKMMASRISQESRQAAERDALLTADAAARQTGVPAGIREIKLLWRDMAGQEGLAKSIDGCLPAGTGTDVVWENGDIFLMKEPGRLKRVWRGESNSHVTMIVANGFRDHICFDGKLVWATVGRHLGVSPWLLAIDPQSERVWEFSAADGLPDIKRAADGANYAHFYAVAPIGPGKICVAGFFGKTWLGTASLDSSGRKSVEVFFEAREPFDREDKAQSLGTTLVFQPSFMLSLANRSLAGGPRRVLVGRGGAHWDCPPLIVDPHAPKVAPAPAGGHLEPRLQQHGRKSAIYEDAIYLVDAAPDLKPVLYRFALPELRPERVIDDAPLGIVVFHNGLLHIVGSEWWTGRLDEKRLSRVVDLLPWSFRSWWPVPGRKPDLPETPEVPRLEWIHHSNHYGLLVKRAWSTAHEAAVFEVRNLLEAAAKSSTENKTADESAPTIP